MLEPDKYDEKIYGVGPLPEHHGSEVWGWWNGCQGIFDCSIRRTKKEAMEMAHEYEPTGAILVPIRAFVEPQANWPMREWREKERAFFD